ncbi:MAG: GNAT family N-acetyltransferase [Candidatus Marsarchaeota archaeon]|jgi:RimJ/RimL family protein N-acetyltransferase|nr:GNAT family N-acetyltransferase [Candidatus Marsarchaeota archaeon]
MKLFGKGFRVYLSELSTDDADEMARLASNPNIARSIASQGEFPSPYTRSDALSFIQFARESLLAMREFHLAMRLESGNALIGVVGLKNVKFIDKKAEIGFWCGEEHWGKGYTKEGARLMMHLAFNVLNFNRIYATAFATNLRSIKLLESLGMVREGIARQDGYDGKAFIDNVLLGLLKEDYRESAEISVEGTAAVGQGL